MGTWTALALTRLLVRNWQPACPPDRCPVQSLTPLLLSFILLVLNKQQISVQLRQAAASCKIAKLIVSAIFSPT